MINCHYCYSYQWMALHT